MPDHDELNIENGEAEVERVRRHVNAVRERIRAIEHDHPSADANEAADPATQPF